MKNSMKLLFAVLFTGVLSTLAFAHPKPVKPFVVVLDAGHGGKDPGNLGNGYMEKIIALKIALKAGAILSKNQDIKVIYTRDNDNFVELTQRGAIANKAKADIFISIHCDSHTSNAHGAGTFVLGLHANKQNFAVAKKENSAIYLEDNFEERYAQYDINAPESVIGFTIMQEEFLDKSIQLAKSMQDRFANKLKRNNRKVKQAGFIVLHQTFMPSVLVETGFLTNAKEGAYLNSKKGQADMAASIAEAVLEYKNSLQSVSIQGTVPAPKKASIEAPVAQKTEAKEAEIAPTEIATETKVKPTEHAPITHGISFKIQLMAVSREIPLTAANFNGLADLSTEPIGSLNRYFYGSTSDYKQAKDLLIQAVNAGYLNAFVAAYKNGEKITLTEALESID